MICFPTPAGKTNANESPRGCQKIRLHDQQPDLFSLEGIRIKSAGHQCGLPLAERMFHWKQLFLAALDNCAYAGYEVISRAISQGIPKNARYGSSSLAGDDDFSADDLPAASGGSGISVPDPTERHERASADFAMFSGICAAQPSPGRAASGPAGRAACIKLRKSSRLIKALRTSKSPSAVKRSGKSSILMMLARFSLLASPPLSPAR